MPLTEAQVRGAFPRAYRAIPKIYREGEELAFHLDESGELFCEYLSAPLDPEKMVKWNRKAREWQ